MVALRKLPPQAREILDLAREDRPAARAAFGALPVERQVALVCESPLARRAELVDMAPNPAELIPALPPAELCFVASAIGLADAGWLLEHATDSQISACVDLDAWENLVPDVKRLGEWLGALIEAGEDVLLRAVHCVDMELWALHLRQRVAVELKPSGDDSWEPPIGGQTLDGQLYFIALHPKDDLGDLVSVLRTLFQFDYWFYFRLLQAVSWEQSSENEEWALRWRTGRMQDLGFPPWEEAMAIYGYLRPDRIDDLPDAPTATEVGEWPLPVWMPELPIPSDGAEAPLLFRTMARLGDEERRSMGFAFLALANRLAVADGMPLGDADSLPTAIDKSAKVASAGLARLAESNALDPVDVLRRTNLDRLFRVGFHLDDSLEVPDSQVTETEAEAEEPD